jgi:hypothetical protein
MEHKDRGMMPFFVINLNGDVERQASVSRELAAAGVTFTRIPAVLEAERLGETGLVDLAAYGVRNRAAESWVRTFAWELAGCDVRRGGYYTAWASSPRYYKSAEAIPACPWMGGMGEL